MKTLLIAICFMIVTSISTYAGTKPNEGIPDILENKEIHQHFSRNNCKILNKLIDALVSDFIMNMNGISDINNRADFDFVLYRYNLSLFLMDMMDNHCYNHFNK